jgi:hypothetical protein
MRHDYARMLVRLCTCRGIVPLSGKCAKRALLSAMEGRKTDRRIFTDPCSPVCENVKKGGNDQVLNTRSARIGNMEGKIKYARSGVITCYLQSGVAGQEIIMPETGTLSENVENYPGIKRLEPGFPVFREAVTAVNRPALSRFEGNFAFLSTVRTGCLCHFAGSEIPRPSVATKII